MKQYIKLVRKCHGLQAGQLDSHKKKDFYQKQQDFNVGAHDQVEANYIVVLKDNTL